MMDMDMDVDSDDLQLKYKPMKMCFVCGDKALGYNFNAVTCEACKAFFRRNALRTKDFKCPFDGNCKIDLVTRRFCQKCRLKKCFDIGMKKEWILSEEEKKVKRDKIMENRRKKDSSTAYSSIDPYSSSSETYSPESKASMHGSYQGCNNSNGGGGGGGITGSGGAGGCGGLGATNEGAINDFLSSNYSLSCLKEGKFFNPIYLLDQYPNFKQFSNAAPTNVVDIRDTSSSPTIAPATTPAAAAAAAAAAVPSQSSASPYSPPIVKVPNLKAADLSNTAIGVSVSPQTNVPKHPLQPHPCNNSSLSSSASTPNIDNEHHHHHHHQTGSSVNVANSATALASAAAAANLYLGKTTATTNSGDNSVKQQFDYYQQQQQQQQQQFIGEPPHPHHPHHHHNHHPHPHSHRLNHHHPPPSPSSSSSMHSITRSIVANNNNNSIITNNNNNNNNQPHNLNGNHHSHHFHPHHPHALQEKFEPNNQALHANRNHVGPHPPPPPPPPPSHPPLPPQSRSQSQFYSKCPIEIKTEYNSDNFDLRYHDASYRCANSYMTQSGGGGVDSKTIVTSPGISHNSNSNSISSSSSRSRSGSQVGCELPAHPINRTFSCSSSSSRGDDRKSSDIFANRSDSVTPLSASSYARLNGGATAATTTTPAAATETTRDTSPIDSSGYPSSDDENLAKRIISYAVDYRKAEMRLLDDAAAAAADRDCRSVIAGNGGNNGSNSFGNNRLPLLAQNINHEAMAAKRRDDPSIQSLSATLSSSPPAEAPPAPPAPPVLCVYNFIEQLRMQELTMSCRALRNWYIGNGDASGGCGGSVPPYEIRDLAELSKTLHSIVRTIIGMAQTITSFNELCGAEKAALLKGSLAELITLRAALCFVPEKDSWLFNLNEKKSGGISRMLAYATYERLISEAYYVELRQFMLSFPAEWKSDKILFDLLTMIILFTPNRSNLKHKEIIKLEYLTYRHLLQKHLESTHCASKEVSRSHFGSLMDLLEQLHQINDKVNQSYIAAFIDDCTLF